MCGRFSLAHLHAIAEFSVLEKVPRLYEPHEGMADTPRYNIAPSQRVAAVRRLPGETEPRIDFLEWGLLPPSAGDRKQGSKLINARGESLASRPAFRDAFRSRRCLVLADGFFEWRLEGRVRQPYHLRRPDGAVFTMAGLWERWHAEDGEVVETCAIVTRPAVPPVTELHDRMPVLVDPKDHAAWLDTDLHDPVVLRQILDVAPPELVVVPVSTRVNKAGVDDPACIERVATTLPLKLG